MSVVRGLVPAGLARPLLKLAHKRAAPLRMLVTVLLGAAWLWFGAQAAVDHAAGVWKGPPPQHATDWKALKPQPPAGAPERQLGALADGVCVLRGGKECDYEVFDGDKAAAQLALAVLAVVTLVFSFWMQLLSAFAHALRSAGRGHVIVTGDGLEPEHLARSAAQKQTVVLLRRDISSAEIDALAADGVAVVAGPPTDIAVLKAAGARHARRIVALGASDAQNVGVAKEVKSLRSAVRAGDVAVRIESPDLRQDLPAGSGLRAADVFSLAEIAARRFTQSTVLLEEALARGADRVHVGIVGWDETAIAVAARTFRLMWAIPFKAPAVTVYTTNATEARRRFEERFPNAALEKVWKADIDFIEYDWRVQGWEALRAGRGTALTAVVVSVEGARGRDEVSEDTQLICAARLARRRIAADPQLFVRENREGSVALAIGHRVRTFGAPSDILSQAALLDAAADHAPRTLHEAYIETAVLDQHPANYVKALKEGDTAFLRLRVMMRRPSASDDSVGAWEHAFQQRFGASALAPLRARVARRLLLAGQFVPKEARPAQRPWSELAEHYITGNRTGADHALFKLWSRGWRHGQAFPEILAASVTDEECELEHLRWSADMLLSGWRAGPRDDHEMTHPDLKPYTDYDARSFEEAKAKDRDPWVNAARVAALAAPPAQLGGAAN